MFVGPTLKRGERRGPLCLKANLRIWDYVFVLMMDEKHLALLALGLAPPGGATGETLR